MTEARSEYQISNKNQAKIDCICSIFSRKVMEWVQTVPTGCRKFTVEINASQGGIGEMFIEQVERGRV